MIKLKDLLLTELKDMSNSKKIPVSHIQTMWRIFSAYAHKTNSKASLIKLYKIKDKPFIKDILASQKFQSPPYYRGMHLMSLPKKGETFEFGLGGWSTKINIAQNFAHNIALPGDNKNFQYRCIFIEKSTKYRFIDLEGFGMAIHKKLRELYPEFPFVMSGTAFNNRQSYPKSFLKKLNTWPDYNDPSWDYGEQVGLGGKYFMTIVELDNITGTGKFRGEYEVIFFPHKSKIKKVNKKNDFYFVEI